MHTKKLRRVDNVVLTRITTNTTLRFQVCFVRPHPEIPGDEQSYGCKPFDQLVDAEAEFNTRLALRR